MKWIKSSGPLIIITIIGLCILIFSIFDIIFEKDWIIRTFASYALLLLITLVVIYLRGKKQEEYIGTLEDFEKTLKGGLYHYKCQTCNGIFAVKKSKSNNKKYVKMTCPDCGAIGFIPPNPIQVEEVIPEKKSSKAKFKCNICSESITVWAEGADLYSDLYVYSCPFCGQDQTMKRI